MTDLVRISEKLIKTDSVEILNDIVRLPSFRFMVNDLITRDQLNTFHEDGEGTPLYLAGENGEYSLMTLELKNITDPKAITLEDTGEFYKSVDVEPLPNGDANTISDPIKDESNLKIGYGEHIDKLNEENEKRAVEFVEKKILEYFFE